MSERYTRVFSLPENLYATGSPVVISAGALLKDNQTGKVLAQLKLTNIQYKKIKAVKVKLFPQDTMGEPLGKAIDHHYLDLQLTRDGDFGAKTPIYFPDATTRAFAAEVTSVVFSDNTAWNADSSPWEPIPASIPLHRQFDNLVIEQLRLEQSGTCQFVVQEHKDLWLCTCGAVNHDGEVRCHNCGKQLSQIYPLDVEGLTARANLRLAEESRQAAEEKAARDAAAEATKKKTAKALKIAVPVGCILIALVILLNTVIIPNSKYKSAISLMEAGEYEEAITAFEALDGYRDSTEQIAKCNDVIIAKEFTRAEELMAVGDYDGAISVFESLADYEGSSEGIAAAEEGKMEVAYQAAEALSKSGAYEEAYKAFSTLSDYKDSKEKANSNYEEYKTEKRNNAALGDYVIFGSYEQDNNTSNGKEEVEWLVLDRQEDKILVISRYALDCLPYDTTGAEVTWETSSIRQWLNSEFINNAFSTTEKAMIMETTVSADKNPEYNTHPGKSTTDQVFLLSIPDVGQYFASNKAKMCVPTDYAIARGAWTSDKSYYSYENRCMWWLRSPGKDQNLATYVIYDHIFFEGYWTYIDDTAVRPALWISLQ